MLQLFISKVIFLTFWLSCTILFIDAYGTGAGKPACSTLKPGHGKRSKEPSPYNISIVGEVLNYTFGNPITGKKWFTLLLYACVNISDDILLL